MPICRSCGFSHKPEDLIGGQCPRWAPADEAHDVDCGCAGHGICDYFNTVPVGPRAE